MGNFGSKKGKKKKGDSKQSDAEKQQLKREQRINSSIQAEMLDDYDRERRVIKLLLLGAGESGKSTLFKQTIMLYGKGFDQKTMDGYLPVIYRNILSGMHVLATQTDLLPNCTADESKDEVVAAKRFFLDLTRPDSSDIKVTPEIAAHVHALWNDPGVQMAFEKRAAFQIPDSTKYFFDEIDRIADPNYVPDYDDILRCRSRTTGIVETCFQIGNDVFKIMDVGGQRSERKKWIHCFEDVTAVIFVAAINEYDQTLYEDNETNRVVEALELFNRTCNMGWFSHASIILFLNKRDLFQEKIKTVDLNVLFPDYSGGCDYANASQYMVDQFEGQNERESTKVYTHITCATDLNNVEFTFNAVKKIVIHNSLVISGLA